jgi:hypothetical protein
VRCRRSCSRGNDRFAALVDAPALRLRDPRERREKRGQQDMNELH